ncbi:MAG TPA: hypothetical protein VKU41_29040 [Polyangiaceae bacterium]|nr:hypothetical protein [Polyangiaceae bacterium]
MILRRQVLAALVAIASVAAVSVPALADKDKDEFEIIVTAHTVVVEAKGDWHINQDYPWKLVVGDTKLDKSKFELKEKKAKIENAPSGTGKIRGAVCSKDSCKMLEREVTIP